MINVFVRLHLFDVVPHCNTVWEVLHVDAVILQVDKVQRRRWNSCKPESCCESFFCTSQFCSYLCKFRRVLLAKKIPWGGLSSAYKMSLCSRNKQLTNRSRAVSNRGIYTKGLLLVAFQNETPKLETSFGNYQGFGLWCHVPTRTDLLPSNTRTQNVIFGPSHWQTKVCASFSCAS